MSHTVIIPTAGLGSRLGDISSYLNKSLVPYCGKPVIAHIIERFPADTKFIIPVGYLAQQVRDFCAMAYSDRHIQFVEIDDYTSTDSGPGYTVSKCLDLIDGPFWYIPCDTYFTESVCDLGLGQDTYFVKQVPEHLTAQYTMFKLDGDTIVDMTFKQPQPTTWFALTGIMYIHDWQTFSTRLRHSRSPEIIWTIKIGSQTARLDSWLDFGNLEIYRMEFARSQKYDFTKTDEITYICNNRVVKWWADPKIAEKKYRKWLTNSAVCPAGCQFQGNWMAYDYFQGTTVYERYNGQILDQMLDWLEQQVWIKHDRDISASSLAFYKTKTIQRINKFLEKYPDIMSATHVDGVAVRDWHYYFDRIDWDLLVNENIPAFTHGDLHFDNTVIDSSGNFCVIDWRHEFADLVETGDVYYDLAKMTGGFIINYSKIKQNDFVVTVNGSQVTLSVPSVENCDEYVKQVKRFVERHGWNYRKVQMLVPIIFWNMAPLHTPPFDRFLWYLGIKLFQALEQEQV